MIKGKGAGLHKFPVSLEATSKKLGARISSKIPWLRKLLIFINRRTVETSTYK
jgi:hypothetical protein